MFIVGDVGGTKTNLAIADQARGVQLETLQTYNNDEFPDFTNVLQRFIADSTDVDSGFSHNSDRQHEISLSVAGPVWNNGCQLVNRNWRIDLPALQQALPVGKLSLLNDLAATALGVSRLAASDFVVLSQGGATAPLPAAEKSKLRFGVISLGTGIGQATLCTSGDRLAPAWVISGEGGHKDFSVSTQEDAALFLALKHWLPREHICVESAVSGLGLKHIYRFHCEQLPDSSQLPQWDRPNINQLIVERGTLETPSVFRSTLLTLCRLFARECANLALQNNCNGGIIIAGGLAVHLLEFLQQPEVVEQFRHQFTDKAPYSEWLSGLTIKICTDIYAPLSGASMLSGQPLE